MIGEEGRVQVRMLRGKKNCALIAQVNFHARSQFQLVRELRIHSRACRRQFLQRCGSLDQAIDQHASGGMGGFAAGLTAFHDEYTDAFFSQGEGDR